MHFRILTDDKAWKEEGVFKSFIAYASFTMFDFPIEFFLAVRFFIKRRGLFNNFLSRYILLHNVICVSCNMLWQFSYLLYLLNNGLIQGSHLIFYLVLIFGYIQEEYVLMSYLLRLH